MTMLYVAYIVLFLSLINLLRMASFAIASDIHDIRSTIKYKNKKSNTYRKRLVTVLVPAHNEELVLKRNIESIYNSTYKNIQLIIVNDSSTDNTYNIARNFQKKYGKKFKGGVKVINVQVRGKARALNAGIKYAKGDLFMCLDADSALAPEAIEVATREFARDPSLACLSANMKIFEGKGILNLLQRVEYLVSYQMKKAETGTGVVYIVGGVGSMYRTKLVKEVGLYDTNTITEDIDLSMKIISTYGKKYKVGYSPDVVTYTEAVGDVGGLMTQRFRWKYGRYQVFLKHMHLFWSRDKKYGKLLSWFYLPYSLISEFMYLLEPLVFMLIIYIVSLYGDATMLAASFLIFTFYIVMNITAATSGYSLKERLKLISVTPVVYIGMFIISLVEYYASVRGIFNFRKLIKEHKTGEASCDWQHVKRIGTEVAS